MKVLFVSGGNNPHFSIAPFIKSQANSLEKNGISVEHYPITGHGLWGYLKHIAPLRKRIRKGNFDLIHAHYTFCGWVAWLAAPGYPLVVSYMGSDTYGSVNLHGRTRLKSLPVVLQGMLLNFPASAIIVKSENLRRKILLKGKTTVIPNGVDFSMFRPMSKEDSRRQLGLLPNDIYLLFAGNPADARKNVELARASTAKLQLERPVHLLTPYPVSHEEMPIWMNASDLLLSTSWLEGSPNVIKEALACNCPVVTTPAGDSVSLVSGVKRCYVTTYNPDNLAELIEKSLFEGGSCDGREKLAHLSSDVIARQIINIYHNIIRP